jgi:hypothetical protein
MTTLSRSKNVAQYMLQEFHRVQFSFIGKLHDSGKIPIIQMRPYCTSVHVHAVSYSASVHVHVVSYSAVRNRRLAFPINASTSQAHRRGGLRAGVLLRRRHPAGPAGADASSGGGPRRHPRPRTSSGRLGRATPRRPTTYSATTATTSAMKPCSSSPAPPSLATSLSCHTKS